MPILGKDSKVPSAVHLLLIGDSKAGKSTYMAEAAISGFNLIYIDVDNGLSALVARINKEPESEREAILNRINYFAPKNPITFVQHFLKSNENKPLLWLPNRDAVPPRIEVDLRKEAQESPDEPMWIIDSTAIPQDFVLVIDSWTSLASDGLGVLRPDQASELLKGDGADKQGQYGDARIKLVYVSNMLQQVPYHVVVQAHATRYEVMSKPEGSKNRVKQAEMTIVETLDVPISSSRQHGLDMASRFNHIGRIEANSLGAPEIDFRPALRKVVGGPPNRKAKTRELTFAQIVAESSTGANVEVMNRPWYQETTLGEFYTEVVSQKKAK